MIRNAKIDGTDSSLPRPADHAEKEFSLILSQDYLGPTIAGKWKRLPDGRILAHFLPWELELVLQIYRDAVQPILAPPGQVEKAISSEGDSAHD